MKKWIITLIILLITLMIAASVYIYTQSRAPLKQAQDYATDIAVNQAGLVQIDEFHLYHGTSAFYVIEGEREKGQKVIVWIPEDQKESVIIKKKSDGISKEQAIAKLLQEENPTKILNTRLGMEKKLPIWEISYIDDQSKLNYYYIHFESGKWWRKIENL